MMKDYRKITVEGATNYNPYQISARNALIWSGRGGEGLEVMVRRNGHTITYRGKEAVKFLRQEPDAE